MTTVDLKDVAQTAFQAFSATDSRKSVQRHGPIPGFLQRLILDQRAVYGRREGPLPLAELAKLPTLPIGIRGTAALMPRSNTGIRPGVVEVHVGRPIAPLSGATAKSRNAAMEQMRLEIARLAGVSTDVPAETECAAAE